MSDTNSKPIVMPRYAGRASDDFWAAIKAVDDTTLYMFGVALQDLESRVLACLNTAIVSTPKKRKKR